MFVTSTILSQQREKRYKYYTFKKGTLFETYFSNDIVLTKDNTTISENKIEFTVQSTIKFPWFNFDKKYIAYPNNDEFSKYMFYSNDEYLLKVFKKIENPGYNIYDISKYIEIVNQIKNSVFCYGVFELDDYFIEVYESYTPLKKVEEELKKQEQTSIEIADNNGKAKLSKIREIYKFLYFGKMVEFVNNIHKKYKDKQMNNYITKSHIFIDKSNGDMKFIPQRLNNIKYTDLYFLILFFVSWCAGKTLTKDTILSDEFEFSYRDLNTWIRYLLNKDKVTYDDISVIVLDLVKQYADNIRIGSVMTEEEVNNILNINPIIYNENEWKDANDIDELSLWNLINNAAKTFGSKISNFMTLLNNQKKK